MVARRQERVFRGAAGRPVWWTIEQRREGIAEKSAEPRGLGAMLSEWV